MSPNTAIEMQSVKGAVVVPVDTPAPYLPPLDSKTNPKEDNNTKEKVTKAVPKVETVSFRYLFHLASPGEMVMTAIGK